MIVSPGNGAVRTVDGFGEISIPWMQSLGCVLWYRGKTTTDFPILPSGTSATPTGTFGTISLDNQRTVTSFINSNNIISVTNNTDYDFGNSPFTICLWSYPISTSGDFVIGIARDSRTYSPYFIYGNNNYPNSGDVSFNLYASNNGTSYNLISGLNFGVGTRNKWYFLVMVRRSNGYIYCSCNDISGSNQNLGTSSFAAGNNPLLIGSDGTTYRNQGVKDLMIFKGVELSTDQLSYIYNTSKKYLVH